MQQTKTTKGHNDLLGTGYLVEIPSFRILGISLEIPSISNSGVKNLLFQNFWNPGFLIKILGISIEILGFSFEIIDISKICDNRIP